MQYYCNECNAIISTEEFYFSMNKYKKALCRNHQKHVQKSRGSTKDLQDFIKKRHAVQNNKQMPELSSIKDWINADVKTWEKIIKNKQKK